jgi:hypothetical protein
VPKNNKISINMKNLEIKCPDLQELNSKELIDNNGGGLVVFAFLAGMALAYYEKRHNG